MKDTWNMTPDEARKYILQNWFDGDENVNAFVCGDEEYTAMAIAVEALEATKWHYPSKGELPPNGGDYLVYIEYEGRGYIRVGQYFGETGWYTDLGEVYGYWTPIAWMPVPEPPKEEA